jgi:hypothetical protein
VKVLKKEICKIPGLEDFKFYYVTTEGEIYSHKHKNLRKLKPCWSNGKKNYLLIRLCDGKGNKKSFYVHQIVLKAFRPNHTNSWGIRHKDNNKENNALSNLEWLGRRREREDGTIELDTDRLELSRELSDYIKLVHLACIQKGIPVPDTYEFFHGILKESLNEYISRYGLKKTMFALGNQI